MPLDLSPDAPEAAVYSPQGWVQATFGVPADVAAAWVAAADDTASLVAVCRLLCHYVTDDGRVEMLSTSAPAFDGATVADVLAAGDAARALEVYRAALVF
jgi:hypothetical protein